MLIVTEGLVCREVLYRDTDKMLTILTRDRGKVSASCPGVRSRQGSMRAGTQFLSYSSFTLYENRGRYTVNAAEPVELFVGLRNDLLALSLASYFAEVLEAISDEEDPSPELLTTGLNCLYALSVRKKPRALIKAAFELRTMMIAGYAPDAAECPVCGAFDVKAPMFDLKTGRIGCASCMPEGGRLVPLCERSLLALRYILSAEPKKLLSFSLEEAPLTLLSKAAELYLSSQLERKFSTLDFYQSLG